MEYEEAYRIGFDNVIITADWHYNAHLPYDGVNRLESAIVGITEHAKNSGCDIIVAGDLFDKNSMDAETATRFANLMTEFLHEHVRIYVLLGNHEMFSAYHNILEQYKVLGSDYIKVVTKPQIIHYKPKNTAFYFFPYGTERLVFKDEFVKLKAKMDNEKECSHSVAIMHASISGLKHNNKEIFSDGLSEDDLHYVSSLFGATFIGHCHYWYNSVKGHRNIIVPGNICQRNFSDINESKRFITLDTTGDTLRWENHKLKTTNKFKELTFTYEDEISLNANIVRLRQLLDRFKNNYILRLLADNVSINDKPAFVKTIREASGDIKYSFKHKSVKKQPKRAKPKKVSDIIGQIVDNEDRGSLKRNRLLAVGNDIAKEAMKEFNENTL